MSGIDVWMSGIDVWMSGIDLLMSGIDVWMSGIDVWIDDGMSGTDVCMMIVWYRCLVKFFLHVCLCSKSGLLSQNSRNFVT